MRWTLAALTSALLSTGAMAQSLQPGFDGALPQVALAPVVSLPVAAIGPASVEHQTAATTTTSGVRLPSEALPASIVETPKEPAATTDEQGLAKSTSRRIRPPHKARTASAPATRARNERIGDTRDYQRTYPVRRDVGRFLPPVF